MNFRNESLKALEQMNVITTEETCSILNRTRQQLNNLLRKNEIEIFKKTSNGNLFWRTDVYKLLQKINKDVARKHHDIYGCTVSEAVAAFKELRINLNEVEQVHIFSNDEDSIKSGYYNLKDVEMPNTLTDIEPARFIMVMRNGEEYWFGGLSCGYDMESCQGSETVLSELGILKKENNNINVIISLYKVLHFYKEDGNWRYTGENFTDDDRNCCWGRKVWRDIESPYFRYNGNLVLTQEEECKTFKRVERSDNETLMKLLYITPNPTIVEILTKTEALETGHFRVGYSESHIFQIVIKDFSKQELWLECPIDTIMKAKVKSIKDICEMVGIVINDDAMPNKLKYLLSVKPRVSCSSGQLL